MDFEELAQASVRVGATSKRLEKRAILSDVIRRLNTNEIAAGVSFLAGQTRQDALGVGFATLGGTKTKPSPKSGLTVAEVDAGFEEISRMAGEGSTGRRADAVERLLSQATAAGQKMLRGLMAGELRQGAQAGVVQDAIAEAFDVPLKGVRRAVMLAGDLGVVAEAALSGGRDAVEAIGLEVGRPVLPMLASSAETAVEAIERTGKSSVEWKLDGARIQVHKLGDEIKVFSRNLRDITSRVPLVVEHARELKAERVLLDGEAISLDDSGRPVAFQDTASAFGTDVGVTEYRLQPFYFDILHLDGRDLLDEPLAMRWEQLESLVGGDSLVARIESDSGEKAESFFHDVVDAGHEGVVVKGLTSTYEAGRRGKSWIKIKPVHTLDLVVLAVEWGSGRRTGWLSNLHLGARDSGTGEFVMLGKTFKGMTDEMLEWQTERFSALKVRETSRTVFVEPVQVVEIAFDGVQRSTRYPGGVALRFARVKRYRDDKDASDADTLETVRSYL